MEQIIYQITLDCLTNADVNKTTNANISGSNLEMLKDIKFYRKRICDLVKKMCHNKFENEDLKLIFHIFVQKIINHFKQVDKHDSLQSDYVDYDNDDNNGLKIGEELDEKKDELIDADDLFFSNKMKNNGSVSPNKTKYITLD